MSRPSRHHTVPQFYLRRWAAADTKQLWVLDKADGRAFRASPKDVALAREFYTDGSGDPSLEARLAQLEVRVAPILKEIVQSESADGLTDNERDWLDLFLAVQLERTQGGRIRQEQLNRATNHYLKAMEARGVDVSKVKADLTTADIRDAHLSSVSNVREFVGPFNRLGMGIRIADENTRFTTSDEPLIFRNKHDETIAEQFRPALSGPTRTIHASRLLRISDRNANATSMGNLGITSPGIEIFLPLSPRVALAALDKRVFPHEKFPQHESWPDEKVNEVRQLALEGSVRYVYASTSDFAHEHALLAQNPEWRDPERARVSVFYMNKELVDASRRGDLDLPFPDDFTTTEGPAK